ncbi:MAG: hypothetical protein AAF891_00755 [Pseudomonadota bacterium]
MQACQPGGPENDIPALRHGDLAEDERCATGNKQQRPAIWGRAVQVAMGVQDLKQRAFMLNAAWRVVDRFMSPQLTQ